MFSYIEHIMVWFSHCLLYSLLYTSPWVMVRDDLLGKKAGRLKLDLIDPLKRLADAPCLVEVLHGDVLVSGLGVDDVPDLEVGPRADQIGRGEVEDGTEAANGLLDHVGLEAGVGHAQEGRVPRLVRAGHGGQAGRRWEARGTAAHSTFRIFNLQYNTTLR